MRNASFFLVGKNILSHLDTGFSVWDNFFLYLPVFYSSDKFFQTLEKLVLRDFFGILAFCDFLKTNFVICLTKNMGKRFVLSDKLLHVACDTWPSLHNILFWHICNVPSNTHTHPCIRHMVQTYYKVIIINYISKTSLYTTFHMYPSGP